MFCSYIFQNTQHFQDEIKTIRTQEFDVETWGTSAKPTDEEVGNVVTPET